MYRSSYSLTSWSTSVIGGIVDHCYEVADAVGIDGKAKGYFSFYFVAFGDGYLPHVVAEADELRALPVVPAGGGAGPGVEVLEDGGVLPVAGDDFAVEAHAGHDESEFAVAVGALVQVHEIHIDRAPGDIAVELGMQVGEGFLEDLQAADPHLGGGEGVHPGDDADTVGGSLLASWQVW